MDKALPALTFSRSGIVSRAYPYASRTIGDGVGSLTRPQSWVDVWFSHLIC